MDWKYYYTGSDDVKIVSNVALDKIERGYYTKQARAYSPWLETIEIEVQQDDSVIMTCHLRTPHLKFTTRPFSDKKA